MPRVDDLLRYMKEHGGSDLHLAAGLEPRVRLHGSLEPVDGQAKLEDSGLRDLLREIATEAHWTDFESCGDLDFAYGLEGVARFRVNCFVQQRGASAVFRIIPDDVITLDKLMLPKAIETLCDLERGLVLVTGPTGSGKSTTLAAMIDRINRESARHVVTLEDPVEFVHKNRQAVFSHREVGEHTLSFGAGLRAAIRQDADVVLVGEMRDYETISLATTAAEMGMLVFGTLHTNGAAKTIDRVIDAFPADEQEQARTSLSESIAGIVSQLLLPTADGDGRRAAVEILLRTSALPNLIREGNTPMISSLIQGGKKQGMQSMDDCLMKLVTDGVVTAKAAYMKASDKERFEALIKPERP